MASASKRKPSSRSAEAERRALKALSFMRKGLSRSKAAARAKTTPETMQRYAKQGIRRREGHYVPTPTDQMRRPMRVLTDQGTVVVDIRSSRVASKVARYFGAVHHFLITGDRKRLRPFEGKAIRADGHRFPFLTDPDLIERLALVGQVQFEDLYETTA